MITRFGADALPFGVWLLDVGTSPYARKLRAALPQHPAPRQLVSNVLSKVG